MTKTISVKYLKSHPTTTPKNVPSTNDDNKPYNIIKENGIEYIIPIFGDFRIISDDQDMQYVQNILNGKNNTKKVKTTKTNTKIITKKRNRINTIVKTIINKKPSTIATRKTITTTTKTVKTTSPTIITSINNTSNDTLNESINDSIEYTINNSVYNSNDDIINNSILEDSTKDKVIIINN
ncbi:hypothetical protein PIROE2DRAFT_59790 [Piromyces sp. E2]|nr:hypothetical protein PIROE2DRAFT_59790 [Piromyces sp. E2]|eukprot:OUM65813.1 hypothetical protein PIROE2DRAFT_59790 [Piromyces sp. E2]